MHPYNEWEGAEKETRFFSCNRQLKSERNKVQTFFCNTDNTKESGKTVDILRYDEWERKNR